MVVQTEQSVDLPESIPRLDAPSAGPSHTPAFAADPLEDIFGDIDSVLQFYEDAPAASSAPSPIEVQTEGPTDAETREAVDIIRFAVSRLWSCPGQIDKFRLEKAVALIESQLNRVPAGDLHLFHGLINLISDVSALRSSVQTVTSEFQEGQQSAMSVIGQHNEMRSAAEDQKGLTAKLSGQFNDARAKVKRLREELRKAEEEEAALGSQLEESKAKESTLQASLLGFFQTLKRDRERLARLSVKKKEAIQAEATMKQRVDQLSTAVNEALNVLELSFSSFQTGRSA